MRRRVGAFATAAVLTAGAGVAGVAVAQGGGSPAHAKETITLRLSYATTQQHPYGQAVDYFAALVAKKSGGRIQIQGRPSYPGSEIALLSDVRRGTADMGTISTAVWDSQGISSFTSLQAPFLVNSYGLERKILTGKIGRQMVNNASKAAGDVKVLAIHEGGFRKPLSTTPLTTVKSFQGQKIRSVQSSVLATGLTALGASPDPLPLPEVFQALKNGTVNGMEANLGLVATQKYYEVAKYITANLNLWPFPTALTINKKKFDSLSAADQKILTDAAAAVPARSIAIVSAKSTLPQDLVNCGIRFVYAPKSELAKFASRGRSATARLAKQNAATGSFVKQIQRLKKSQPAGKPPAKLPSKATGACTLG